MPKPHEDKRPSPELAEELAGHVISVNYSPRGATEGLIVETARGVVQVNLPKDGLPAGVPSRAGAPVKLRACREDDEHQRRALRPVYRLLDDDAVAEGTIVVLNHSRHGEVNGVQLDDGVFVHLKPDGAREHRLTVGDRIRASGHRRHGSDAVVLEAEDVDRVARPARISSRARARCPS